MASDQPADELNYSPAAAATTAPAATVPLLLVVGY